MVVEHVELLVEEPSMAAALGALLPKLLRGPTWNIHEHRGKGNLLKALPKRLAGYARWIPQSWRIVVIADRDDEECEKLKASMEQAARDAGLATRSASSTGRFQVVNRIAIEELEAWFFGDWQAVAEAFPRVPGGVAQQKAYRDPDAIRGGTWEALERILQASHYFKTGLPKVSTARAIAEKMEPARNTSPSFCALRDALAAMATP